MKNMGQFIFFPRMKAALLLSVRHKLRVNNQNGGQNAQTCENDKFL